MKKSNKKTIQSKTKTKNKGKKAFAVKFKKTLIAKKTLKKLIKKIKAKASVKKKTKAPIKKRKVLAKKTKIPKKAAKKVVTSAKRKDKSIVAVALKKPASITKSGAVISGPMGIKPYAPTKSEAYMCPKQIAHFKTILNIWKEQLMAEMNRTVQHMKNDAANFPDPIDRASQEEEFNLELKTRERERKLIKKIDEALEKMQGGDYGFCVDCGADIGIKRLEARPTASQCIECKTIAEIREKQTGG